MAAILTQRKAGTRLALVALAVLALDQLTKWWVVHGLDLANKLLIEVWPPFLVFQMAWNEGINFGIPLGGKWFLIGMSVAISAGLVVWAMRRRTAAFVLGTGILVGGALGNALDRVLYGAVADFLNMSCCGIVNPYAFNVADIAIFLGALIIAIKG